MRCCLRYLPFCGGWCDETESPEPSWARRFSNEKTLTRFCYIYSLRRLCEHSACCRRAGAVGCAAGERHRRCIMSAAFVFSVVGWVCMLLSALGLANSPALLPHFAWSGSVYKFRAPNNTTLDMDVRIYYGISGRLTVLNGIRPVDFESGHSVRGVRDPGVSGLQIGPIPWPTGDASCTGLQLGLVGGTDASLQHACDACAATAAQTRSFIVSSCLTQLFQVVTDLQRLTRYGDVNCQKSFGTATSALGLLTGSLSLASFRYGCMSALPHSALFHGATFHPYVRIRATNYLESGFLLMLVGTMLKLFDVVAHLVVPTPHQKRQPPSGRTSLVEYLKSATPAEPATANASESKVAGPRPGADAAEVRVSVYGDGPT